MAKSILFFLHPNSISTAVRGEEDKLTSLSLNGMHQVPCETMEEVDSFCELFLEFYNIDELTDLDASYFMIDAGARQEIRTRFFAKFKRCPRVSSLFFDQALPFALLGKNPCSLSSSIELAYHGEAYRLFAQEGSAVDGESCEHSAQKASIEIKDEDFFALVHPFAIQALLNGYEEKLRLATDENARLQERLDVLEKAERLRTFLVEAGQKGNYVTFGRYEWLVLDRQDNRALLISRDALEQRSFDQKSNNWEESELRAYLNGEFYEKSFSAEERKRILQTDLFTQGITNARTMLDALEAWQSLDLKKIILENGSVDFKDVEIQSTTRDHIFLLSLEEAQRYFDSDQARTCLLLGDDFSCLYWLRSPGSYADVVLTVGDDGSVQEIGGLFVTFYGAVRPALWVNIEP